VAKKKKPGYRKPPELTPHGTIKIQFTEEPSDDDWFALMSFLRASTVYDDTDHGYDITIIPAEFREECQREDDLEREPVFVVLAGGMIRLYWDAEGHVMDNETAGMDPDEEDDQ